MSSIVKLAASAQPGEKKHILFAGAGVSKDAGYPIAWDLMRKTAGLLYPADYKEKSPPKDVDQWFLSSPCAQMQYADLIENLYPHYLE